LELLIFKSTNNKYSFPLNLEAAITNYVQGDSRLAHRTGKLPSPGSTKINGTFGAEKLHRSKVTVVGCVLSSVRIKVITMAQKPITALIRGVRQYNHNCSLINALEKQNAQTKFQGFKVSKWGAGFIWLTCCSQVQGKHNISSCSCTPRL